MSLRVRPIQERDIERLLWIESIAWRDGVQFTEEHLRSQLEIFPEGQLCCEDDQGRVWGFANMMQVRFDPREPLQGSWDSITAEGSIRTHDHGGNWLFGVNLSVHARGSRLGATEALIVTASRICIYRHLKGILLVGRMPGYARWLRNHPAPLAHVNGTSLELARTYLETRVPTGNGHLRRLDPQLEMYERYGMRILDPIPDFISDEKSHDFGVALVWPNCLYVPYYLCPSTRVWKHLIFGPVGKALERAYLGLASRLRSTRSRGHPGSDRPS